MLASAALPNRPDISSVEQTLVAEREHLRAGGHPATEPRLAALCLSGGGIRSAAFSLGVLQALAGGRLLSGFDYLSTVSGGGFIGGWLQVLIHRKGVRGAEATLQDPQAPELVALRSYTNYLTPQAGPFTSDTWTAVALYLRNLLLNWLVIVPALLMLVLVLIMHRTAVATFGRPELWPWLVLAIAMAMLFVATMQACMLLPSHRADSPAPDPRRYASPDVIQRWIVYPTLAWSLVTPVALHAMLADAAKPATWVLPACYAVVMLGAYACAWARQRSLPAMAELFEVNAPAWIAATLLATTALVVAERWYLNLRPGDQAQALTTFAPLALTLCHMLHAVIYVGLRRERMFSDLDREWIARVDGTILLYAFAWTAVCLCCLELSSLLIPADGRPFGTGTTWAVGIVTFLSGPGVAWVGKQTLSRVEKGIAAASGTQLSLLRLLNLFAAVFAVGLFAFFGVALQFLLGVAQQRLGLRGADIGVFLLLLGLQLLFGVLLFWLSWGFSRVNVNRFSMHGVYRDRLSRAFLGTALEDRRPDPFTGFGPLENPRLAGLAAEPGAAKLFPVINIALNLTRSTHTAWAERKAASFTATPLACGSAELPNPNGGGLTGAFVATPNFAGATSPYDKDGARAGIRLGTALTISGAAVSPNWGYNSSPLTAFLMTMFNVRLGAWLPNPAVSDEKSLRLAMPRNSQAAIFDELMGVATDQRQSVYLSDGGHFENLGMYEMLRRQCSHMLVVDAGQDAGYAFADLGNAIRKAAIDGLAEVAMRPIRILSRSVLETEHAAAAEALGLAVGTITYPGGRTGKLIYLKPSYLPSIPAEIRAYGAAHPEFPHESTAEQWFTESQFESYRALGAWQTAELVRGVAPDAADPFDALFEQAWTMTAPKESCPVHTATP